MDSKQVLSLLKQHHVDYQLYHHPAVFTSEQADQYLKDKDFARCKNLFLKTRNNKNYYLFMLPDKKRLDMKKAREQLNCGSLTFASENDLESKLGVKSGAVSPLNLLNDKSNQVHLVVDQAAVNENDKVGVHPNDNTMTVVLKWTELARFVGTYGNPFEERTL